MHDPTEGGVATALWELAEASGQTLHVTAEAWPLLPEAAQLCAFYGLDPLGAIASGALLLTVKPDLEVAVVEALAAAGIAAYHLGHMAQGAPEVHFQGGILPRPAQDEVTRLFD